VATDSKREKITMPESEDSINSINEIKTLQSNKDDNAGFIDDSTRETINTDTDRNKAAKKENEGNPSVINEQGQELFQKVDPDK
jgi:hypothetical protein